MRRMIRAMLALIAAVSAPTVGAQSIASAYTLEIDRVPLTAALTTFSEQTGFLVHYVTRARDDRIVGPLKGQYTVEAALNELVKRNGLTYSLVRPGVIRILDPNASAKSGPGLVKLAMLSPEPQSSAGAQRSDSGDARSDVAIRRDLEEVIVTAQKRTQNVQDVPISIAVVSADQISRRALANAEDYLRGVPGANQVDSPYGQSIIIRGLETSPHLQNNFSGPTTATYFGETPTTSAAGLLSATNVDLKLVDIERVEVLRGPQGTAFGSSSLGGAVRTIPVAPQLDRFAAKAAAGYSVTSGAGGDNYDVQATVNVPLVQDKFAIRVVGYQYDDSGYYRNRAGSDAAYQAAAVTPFRADAFARDEKEVGSYYVLGGRLSALFQATDDLQFKLSYMSQKTETDGFALANSGTFDQTLLQVAPEHVIRGENGGVSDTDIDMANIVMEYSFGWADLLATYSRIESGSIQSYPLGAAALNWAMSSTADSDHRENVGEIRLVTSLSGAWNFLAGLYTEDLDDKSRGDNRWYGDIATAPLVLPGATDPALGTAVNQAEVKQTAAFGEVSWEMVEGLTLTGGVRAYEYDRRLKTDGVGYFYGGAAGTHVDRKTDASGENFRANLSYKFNEEGLLYAGWSQGFRLGKPQTGLVPSVCDRDNDGLVDGTGISIESTRHTDSDSVDNYEVGGKFAVLDRRVTIDAAVFRMEWSGVPVQIRPGTAPCVAGYVANAGEALSEGVELQTRFQVTEAFRIDLGGSWVHARLTEAVPALGAPDGRELPGAPEYNANLGMEYAFEVGGHKASVRADSIYVGSYFGNLQQSPNVETDDYVKVDASARLEIRDLKIDLFVRNLTDEDAFSFRSTFTNTNQFFGYRIRPRTIGLRFGYAF